MDTLTVFIQTEIKPTENYEKVEAAISNIFRNVKFKIDTGNNSEILKVEMKGKESLFRFRDLLRLDQIRSAARKVLFRGITEKNIVFFLNKQVAFANHISFSEEESESPLGPIRVQIICEDPQSLIIWLTPKTV